MAAIAVVPLPEGDAQVRGEGDGTREGGTRLESDERKKAQRVPISGGLEKSYTGKKKVRRALIENGAAGPPEPEG